MATGSEVFAMEGLLVLVQVASGPMSVGAPGDFRERSSRLAPQLKRLVFEEEGRKIGLLPYEVDF